MVHLGRWSVQGVRILLQWIIWESNKAIDIGELSICGGGGLERFYCRGMSDMYIYIYIYTYICIYVCIYIYMWLVHQTRHTVRYIHIYVLNNLLCVYKLRMHPNVFGRCPDTDPHIPNQCDILIVGHSLHPANSDPSPTDPNGHSLLTFNFCYQAGIYPLTWGINLKPNNVMVFLFPSTSTIYVLCNPLWEYYLTLHNT